MMARLFLQRLAAAGDGCQIVHEIGPTGGAAEEPPGVQARLVEDEPAAVLQRRKLPTDDRVAAAREPLERPQAWRIEGDDAALDEVVVSTREHDEVVSAQAQVDFDGVAEPI